MPGDPSTSTGGYIYDGQILAGLAELGWRTRVHSLDASFPRPTPAALRDARAQLAALRGDSAIVIDGLALAGLERVLETEAKRLAIVALVHHPLALETGVAAAEAQRLEAAERDALAFARRVIVTSQWTARALGRYDVPIERIRVVEPGVDRRPRRKSRAARVVTRTLAPPAAEAVRLLCVATITPRKGHTVLLEALAELRDRPWQLTCAGSITRDAATFAALEHQVERLALRARVRFLGDLDADALEREYESADLFVLASYLEGYGMALAEAVARGVPVVSTTAGAIPETVPAAAGVLVPPGDSRALAKALGSLLEDAGARARLAASARAAARKLPTWRMATEKFAAALDGVVRPAGTR